LCNIRRHVFKAQLIVIRTAREAQRVDIFGGDAIYSHAGNARLFQQPPVAMIAFGFVRQLRIVHIRHESLNEL
jgi:hypothetical protein